MVGLPRGLWTDKLLLASLTGRRYRLDGGLYLDGDSPAGSTVANNLADAVAWLVLVVPSLLIPLGVLAAGFLAVVSRKVAAC